MVPNMYMKTFFNFCIFWIFWIFRPSRFPAWPASQPGWWRARFGYMVPNLHMNWPDSAIWYQICIWRGQIRLYGTKFAYEAVFQFFDFFDFFDFQARQTSSLASQPAWLVEDKIRLYDIKYVYELARFSYMVPNM